MLKLSVAVLALLHALLPGPSAAEERIGATLTVTLEQEGGRPAFRVEGRLERPVESFRFALPPEQEEAVDWQAAEPGLRLSGTRLGREDGRPLDRFTLLVRADRKRVDRRYPLAIAVGSRGLLLRPAFLVGETERFQTRIRMEAGAGYRVIGSGTWEPQTRPGPDQRVAVVPAEEVRDEGFALFVTPSEMDPAFRLDMVEQMRGVLAFYTERLGRAPAARPTILLGREELGRGGIRGDSSAGAMVALRVGGEGWAALDEGQRRRLPKLIAHEAFHLWNGEIGWTADGSEQPWLHEGGAEYAALLALIRTGRMDGAEARSTLEAALGDCVDLLGAQSLAGGGTATRGQAPYACGIALQWMADLALKRRGGGVLEVWREMIARPGGSYRSDDFLRLAFGGDAPEAARLILWDGGPDRWTGLPRALAGLGVEVAAGQPRPEKLARQLFIHLLEASCASGRRGFWLHPDRVDFETGAACGPLSGNPRIDRVEGHPFPAGAVDAYDAAARKCASGQPVVLGVAGSTNTIAAPCANPLPAAPAGIRIVEASAPS